MKQNNALKQSVRYLITGFIILIGLVTLISSGGGGSDGEGDSNISYTGSTEMAVINADNAIELTIGAHVAGPVFTGPGRMAVDSSYEEKIFLYDGASLFLRPISKGIEKIAISAEVVPELREILSATETLDGNCGGSVTSTIELDDTNGNFTGTLVYDRYCEDGETTIGTVNVSGSVDLATLDFIYMEMSYSQLTVTSAIGSVTMNGTTRINYSANSWLRTANYLIRDNGTGKVYKIENYVESFLEGMGWVERTVSSGRYYHPDYGYVNVKSSVPYMYYYGDAGPSSGELIITGNSGTKASLMALSSTGFKVTVDTNGDGTFDWSSNILYWLGGGDSNISYTGSTEMAVITADNAVELATGAYFGGPAIEVITILGVGPEFNGEPVNGNCGGTATLTVDSMDNTSGAFTGTAEFDGYCEDGETVFGTVNLSGTIEIATIEQDLIKMDASFSSLTVTSSSGSVTLSGTTSTDHSLSSDVMTANYLSRDNTTGKVYKVENYVVSILGGLDWVELTYSSGRYYHPDHGYVEVISAVPFIYYASEIAPSSGELMITGDSGTKASLTALTSSTYEVTADTDGDGTVDWSSATLNWITP